MTDFEAFLTEAFPSLGLSPSACRRRNIRRRVTRRMESLGIHEFRVYLEFLRESRSEQDALRPLLTVTISRFFRNRRVFETLSRRGLPLLSSGGKPLRAWCAGCASGEEPYTLRIVWEETPGPRPSLRILGTDVDEACLLRAREGTYPESSLREVPPRVVLAYFLKEDRRYRLRADVLRSVRFSTHDLLRDPPPGAFDFILCRNAAFTYFDPSRRVAVAEAFATALPPGGLLVLGRTEGLPREADEWFAPAFGPERIYRRIGPVPVPAADSPSRRSGQTSPR